MLRSDSWLVFNEEEVAAKVMDGEAIIINLESGMYYSMDGAGADIWSLLSEGITLGQVQTAITSRYGVSAEDAAHDVERLAAQLIEERLLRLAEGAPKPIDMAAWANGGPATQPYSTPELNAYRDMADLLALDPPMPGLRATPWQGPETDGNA
jgi:hypothetical protein